VRKIVALAEIHGDAPVGRALADALAFEAFSSDYIEHLIQARGRALPEASPLVLMRRKRPAAPPVNLLSYLPFFGFQQGDINGTKAKRRILERSH
jgi:hypothetical protein